MLLENYLKTKKKSYINFLILVREYMKRIRNNTIITQRSLEK